MLTREALRMISWVDNDHRTIRPTMRPLEREGFEIVTYSTYNEAAVNRAKIGQTDLLLVATVLPSGAEAPEKIRNIIQAKLGLKLLQTLREDGYNLPAVFWDIVPPTDFAELDKLNATFIQRHVLPSELQAHIRKRLG